MMDFNKLADFLPRLDESLKTTTFYVQTGQPDGKRQFRRPNYDSFITIGHSTTSILKR